MFPYCFNGLLALQIYTVLYVIHAMNCIGGDACASAVAMEVGAL